MSSCLSKLGLGPRVIPRTGRQMVDPCIFRRDPVSGLSAAMPCQAGPRARRRRPRRGGGLIMEICRLGTGPRLTRHRASAGAGRWGIRRRCNALTCSGLGGINNIPVVRTFEINTYLSSSRQRRIVQNIITTHPQSEQNTQPIVTMPYSLTVKKTEGKPGEVYYPCVTPFSFTLSSLSLTSLTTNTAHQPPTQHHPRPYPRPQAAPRPPLSGSPQPPRPLHPPAPLPGNLLHVAPPRRRLRHRHGPGRRLLARLPAQRPRAAPPHARLAVGAGGAREPR